MRICLLRWGALIWIVLALGGCSLGEVDFTGDQIVTEEKLKVELLHYPYDWMGEFELRADARDFYDRYAARRRLTQKPLCDYYRGYQYYGCAFFARSKRDQHIVLLYIDWSQKGNVAIFYELLDLGLKPHDFFLAPESGPVIADLENGGDHQMERDGFALLFFRRAKIVFYWSEKQNKFIRVHARELDT